MLWSIDSRQNRVSADQYHLTLSQALVSTQWGRVFLKFSADKLSQLKFIVFKFIWNMLCLCHYFPTLLRFWLQTELRRENSASNLKMQEGKTLLTMVTLYVFFMLWLGNIWQVSSCGKFMQRLETCLLWQLKLTVLCQLVMFFNCRFPSLPKYPFLLALRRWGRFARRKFHTDDVNQCLLNKSGNYGVPNANLFNFTFLLVDFGKVLCSSANEIQRNSNALSREDYIPQTLTALLEIHSVYIWAL